VLSEKVSTVALSVLLCLEWVVGFGSLKKRKNLQDKTNVCVLSLEITMYSVH